MSEGTSTGARSANRGEVPANTFALSRSLWNLHDALLLEQRRTNQLLEALLEAQGVPVPEPWPAPPPYGTAFDPSTGLPIAEVKGYHGA